MTANLPAVDPAKAHAPVLLVRGEYDGIATEEDLVAFFRKLANRDKQLVVLPGMSHALAFGYNREQLWHVMRSFLDMPSRRDRASARAATWSTRSTASRRRCSARDRTLRQDRCHFDTVAG